MKVLSILFAVTILIVALASCSQSPNNPLDNKPKNPSLEEVKKIVGLLVYDKKDDSVAYSNYCYDNFDYKDANTVIPYPIDTIKKYVNDNLTNPDKNDWRLVFISRKSIIKIRRCLDLYHSPLLTLSIFSWDTTNQKSFLFETPDPQYLLINFAINPKAETYLEQKNNLEKNYPNLGILRASVFTQALTNVILITGNSISNEANDWQDVFTAGSKNGLCPIVMYINKKLLISSFPDDYVPPSGDYFGLAIYLIPQL